MQKFLLVCLLLFPLTACLPASGNPPTTPPSTSQPWAGALRALDPADTADPAQDITAVYLREQDDQLQVRVDLLDFHNPDDLSIDIRIQDATSPGKEPYTIHIPSESLPARISLDPLLDTVIIEVPFPEIPSRPRVDVSTAQEELTGLRLDSPVPNQTAPLLLTFYDTFAGRFPAEALRSWDGAHTGPRGERHGLKHLLEAAEEYQTPIVLLDLKDPESLSALDAMGVLPQIQHIQATDLLALPQTSSDKASFGLPASVYLFSPGATGKSISKYRFQFSAEPSHLQRWFEFPEGTFTTIPIATQSDANQPTPDGPSLEVRRALLETALDGDEKDLLVLGGSLRDSTWGSPAMVGPTLAYFASRPYIHLLTADTLIHFPAKFGKPAFRSPPLDEPARQLEMHYENLTQPVLDFVANWKSSPLSSCETDIDQDGQPECILANGGYLAVLDPQGARLTYLFAVGLVGNPLHQLIGPSWQVAVGLSNPSLWDLSAGEAADPGAYPGAFADADDPFKAYQPAIAGDTVVFTSLDGARTKSFRLRETGLEVAYQTQKPVRTQIPLLVEPERRFTPGWAENYRQEKTPGGVAWGLENGSMVRIQVEGPLTVRAFNELLSLLGGPENPDFDYPPGHYVPFPMAIAEVEMRGGYFLRLERLP